MSVWLNRTQLAEMLGTHPNSIFRLERRSDFPRRSTALGPPRWKKEEVEEFMRKGQRRLDPPSNEA